MPTIYQAVHKHILETMNKELINVARRSEPSVLRKRTYDGLSESTWMDEVLNEITTRSPTVSDTLCMLLDYPLNSQKKLPSMCLIYGIIMFLRCHELSRIQRINSVLLSQVNTQVSFVTFCHNLK